MIDKFVSLVKGQLVHYDNQVNRFGPNHPKYRPQQIAMYRRLVEDHRELLAYLENLKAGGTVGKPKTLQPEQETAPAPSVPSTAPTEANHMARADLADLPPELLAELSESARGEVDPLIQIIRDRGGIASLDDILIDLFRKHGEIGKRNIVANKLYRLSRRHLCWSVPGRKGIYTTVQIEGVAGDDGGEGNESDEGPDAETSGPSTNSGAAGSPVSSIKASLVGSIPTASTQFRNKLLAGTAVLQKGH
jgi:hypothetical protein